jgi:hypothetical protein
MDIEGPGMKEIECLSIKKKKVDLSLSLSLSLSLFSLPKMLIAFIYADAPRTHFASFRKGRPRRRKCFGVTRAIINPLSGGIFLFSQTEINLSYVCSLSGGRRLLRSSKDRRSNEDKLQAKYCRACFAPGQRPNNS